MNPIFLALAIALALSLAGNAAMGWAWLGTRDDLASALVRQQAAEGAAQQCSEGVAALQARAAAAARASAVQRAAAAASAAAGDARADVILASPPSTPADDCKSAVDQVDQWLQSRARP